GDHLGVPAPSPTAAGMGADEPVGGHQPRDAFAADPVTGTTELAPHPRRPVGAARRSVDLADLAQQRLIGALPGRGLTGPPRVEARPRHAGDPAQIDDPVLGLVLVDEAEAGHRIVSRAN